MINDDVKTKLLLGSNTSLRVPVFKKKGTALHHLQDIPRPNPGIDYIETVHLEILMKCWSMYAQETE